MTKWKGQSVGRSAGYKIFYFTLKFLGLRFAYFLLCYVAGYYVVFKVNAVRPVHWYAKIIHNKKGIKLWIFIYRNFYVFGQILIDKVAIELNLKNKFTFEFDGEEHLKKLSESENGSVVIGAHVGSWQIGKVLLERFNAVFSLVMIDQEYQRIKQYLSNAEDQNNVKVIRIQDDFSHVIEISKALKNREIVGVHGDRFIEGVDTKLIDFLGRKANFPVNPFELPTRLNIPASFFFIIRKPGRKYHFIATEPKIYGKGGEELLMNDYISHLQKIVSKYPLQWFNYYDFWEDQSC